MNCLEALSADKPLPSATYTEAWLEWMLGVGAECAEPAEFLPAVGMSVTCESDAAVMEQLRLAAQPPEFWADKPSAEAMANHGGLCGTVQSVDGKMATVHFADAGDAPLELPVAAVLPWGASGRAASTMHQLLQKKATVIKSEANAKPIEVHVDGADGLVLEFDKAALLPEGYQLSITRDLEGKLPAPQMSTGYTSGDQLLPWAFVNTSDKSTLTNGNLTIEPNTTSRFSQRLNASFTQGLHRVALQIDRVGSE